MKTDYQTLYSGMGLESPKLMGYVYEYETVEENVDYWNSLNPEEQEALVNKSEMGKTDLRSLIREKRRSVE